MGTQKMTKENAIIKELKALGLVQRVLVVCPTGLVTQWASEMQEKFQGIARELGLQISGGTVFHAAMKPHIAIGRGTGNLEIPYEVLENLKIYYKNKKEGTSK